MVQDIYRRTLMATINNLSKSISDMSDDELYDKLRGIRQKLRQVKSPTVTSKAKKKANPKAILAGMPEELRKALIEELEGELE